MKRRRVIYMDDAQWENVKALSDGQHISISEVMRRAFLPPFTHIVAPSSGNLVAPVVPETGLSRVEFRPAPKPSAKVKR